MTQDQYTLLTGQCLNISDTDWAVLLGIAEMRLASFLCLDELPDVTDEANADLALLLANFICATGKFIGAPDVIESKSIRNFTINFKSSATTAFEQIYKQYKDIIERYSNCGTGLKVERNAPYCGLYNHGYLNL